MSWRLQGKLRGIEHTIVAYASWFIICIYLLYRYLVLGTRIYALFKKIKTVSTFHFLVFNLRFTFHVFENVKITADILISWQC